MWDIKLIGIKILSTQELKSSAIDTLIGNNYIIEEYKKMKRTNLFSA
jgi:hypothetical protein